MFERILTRLAQKQVAKAISTPEYSIGTSASKGATPAILALLVPVIINLLGKQGIVISDGDALQIILWALAGGSIIRNWFKNYLIPKFKK